MVVRRGRSEVHGAKNDKRATRVDAGETVSPQCLEGHATSVLTHPPRACPDRLFSRGPYVEPRSDARTKLAAFFTILLPIQTVTDREMQHDHRSRQLMLHVQGARSPHRLYRRVIQRLMSGTLDHLDIFQLPILSDGNLQHDLAFPAIQAGGAGIMP